MHTSMTGESCVWGRGMAVTGYAGKCFFNSFGAVERYDLAPGQDLVVGMWCLMTFSLLLPLLLAAPAMCINVRGGGS